MEVGADVWVKNSSYKDAAHDELWTAKTIQSKVLNQLFLQMYVHFYIIQDTTVGNQSRVTIIDDSGTEVKFRYLIF